MSKSRPQVEKLTYTIQEAADAIGMSHMTIRRAIDAGTLPASRPTSVWLILKDDLLRWATTDRRTA